MSLASRGAGCLLGSGWVALVVLGSLALLALVLLGLLCHYRARHLAVRRVRSRLYSRLYRCTSLSPAPVHLYLYT